MNMLYRNSITNEIVNATIRTIKGKLKAVIINISNNMVTTMDESKFNDFFIHINGKSELTESEIIMVNRYFK